MFRRAITASLSCRVVVWAIVVLSIASASSAAVLLVSDTGNGRVLQYQVDGGSITYDQVFAQGSLAGAPLNAAMGMTIGNDGWIYVGEEANGGRVLRFAPDGTFINVVAAFGANNRPESVEAGPDGSIYVTDAFGSAGDQVFKINVANAADTVSTFIAQTGTGYSLANPRGLSFGPSGNVFISDRDNNRVREFNGTTGAFVSDFISSVSSPQDVYWHDGNVYVTSGSTVRQYDGSGTFVGSYAVGSGINIGIGALGSDIYSAAFSANQVYRHTPSTTTVVVPAGGEPAPAISGPGHVLLLSGPEQTAAFDTVADAHVNVSNGTNYGSLDRLRVGIEGGGDAAGQHQAFIRFDTSSIPADATIVNAMFRAVQTDGTVGAGFRVREVTSAWDESTISGTAMPSVASGTLGDMTLYGSGTPQAGISVFNNANLTQLVQDWTGGHKGNNGLNFQILSTAAGDTFASKENTAGRDPARLVLVYESARQYTRTVQADGPLAYYRFSETAGPTARDSADAAGSPNFGSQDGTISSVALGQAGPTASQFPGFEVNNRAAGYSSSGSDVDLGFQIRNELAALAPGAISIEAWVNKDDLAGTEFVAATRINGGQAGAELLFSNGNLRMAGRSRASDGYQNANVDFLAAGGSTGQWHHVVGVLDYPHDQIRLWLDGDLVLTYAATFGSNTYSIGSSMTEPDSLGSSPAGGGAFQGLLDEIAFYAFALDDPNGDGNLADSRVLDHFTAAVPEPASLAMLLSGGLGLLGLCLARRRRNADH